MFVCYCFKGSLHQVEEYVIISLEASQFCSTHAQCIVPVHKTANQGPSKK